MTKKRRIQADDAGKRGPAEGRTDEQQDQKAGVEGEGSYSATRNYDERTRRFVEEHGTDVEAESMTPDEAAQGERAMDEARRRSRATPEDEREDAAGMAGNPPRRPDERQDRSTNRDR